MILSRAMRQEDYNLMIDEQVLMKEIKDTTGMWYPPQHQHRVWEYALATKALWTVFGKEKKELLVSDHGCGAGFMSPILYWLGHHVKMYECWTMGSAENYMMEQMRRVGIHRKEKCGTYEMRTHPLCELTDEDRGVDAAFCISTIEHIGEYQKAFRDLLSSVKPGGLVFITSDFAEDEEDHYKYAHLRAGKMFTDRTYREMEAIGDELGFELLGNQDSWNWEESCRLVNDYGFASLAMIKRTKELEPNENVSENK